MITRSLEKYNTYCFSIFFILNCFQNKRLQSDKFFLLNYWCKSRKIKWKGNFFAFFCDLNYLIIINMSKMFKLIKETKENYESLKLFNFEF